MLAKIALEIDKERSGLLISPLFFMPPPPNSGNTLIIILESSAHATSPNIQSPHPDLKIKRLSEWKPQLI